MGDCHVLPRVHDSSFNIVHHFVSDHGARTFKDIQQTR